MLFFKAGLIFVVVFFTATNSGLSQSVVWDTVGTGIVQLAVSNHGSMGLNGIGGANMDFTSSGLDCDPNADVYLNSGGLFIIQKIDSAAGTERAQKPIITPAIRNIFFLLAETSILYSLCESICSLNLVNQSWRIELSNFSSKFC